jgi:hypothetical protein
MLIWRYSSWNLHISLRSYTWRYRGWGHNFIQIV